MTLLHALAGYAAFWLLVFISLGLVLWYAAVRTANMSHTQPLVIVAVIFGLILCSSVSL
jgi:hypothetical protein